MDYREKILDNAHLPYIYPYTLRNDRHIGDVWAWVLGGEWRDRDFKWNGRTFYFKCEQDLMLFMLRWS